MGAEDRGPKIRAEGQGSRNTNTQIYLVVETSSLYIRYHKIFRFVNYATMDDTFRFFFSFFFFVLVVIRAIDIYLL